MRVMTDKALEHTISFLVKMYLNRKITKVKQIIKQGGTPIMKLDASIGRLAFSIKVQESRIVFDEQEKVKSTIPYEAFNLNMELADTKNTSEMNLEEFSKVLDTGKELISEGRDKLYVPLMNLADKYMDRVANAGEKFWNKKLEGMTISDSAAANINEAVVNTFKRVEDVSAQVAVVQDTLDKQTPKQ